MGQVKRGAKAFCLRDLPVLNGRRNSQGKVCDVTMNMSVEEKPHVEVRASFSRGSRGFCRPCLDQVPEGPRVESSGRGCREHREDRLGKFAGSRNQRR